jgi:hypothetical protein
MNITIRFPSEYALITDSKSKYYLTIGKVVSLENISYHAIPPGITSITSPVVCVKENIYRCDNAFGGRYLTDTTTTEVNISISKLRFL